MSTDEVSIFESLKSTLAEFVNYYRESHISYASVTAASVLFGISGIAGDTIVQDLLRAGAFLVILGSVTYTYYIGRPFGMQVSWTPTHLVDGERQPDKMSESRGLALVQEDSTVIHGKVELSRLLDSFAIRFKTSDEINAELQTVPRREQKYDPEQNTLRCEDVTERRFPLKIEIYPDSSSVSSGRYHSVEIVAVDGNRELASFEVIDVRLTVPT